MKYVIAETLISPKKPPVWQPLQQTYAYRKDFVWEDNWGREYAATALVSVSPQNDVVVTAYFEGGLNLP